ncbi:hypothetical protein MRB53_041386 [Persea americana]|nr:hypothetical protein MRB53_041386 [Persea americana]
MSTIHGLTQCRTEATKRGASGACDHLTALSDACLSLATPLNDPCSTPTRDRWSVSCIASTRAQPHEHSARSVCQQSRVFLRRLQSHDFSHVCPEKRCTASPHQPRAPHSISLIMTEPFSIRLFAPTAITWWPHLAGACLPSHNGSFKGLSAIWDCCSVGEAQAVCQKLTILMQHARYKVVDERYATVHQCMI